MPRRYWRIVLVVAVAEFTLLLGILAALAVANGGLVVSIGPRDRHPSGSLLIPVAGVRPHDLRDSYGQPRSGGREHDGIDIFAPANTPVRAPRDAIVVQRAQGGAGGIALYLRDVDGVTVYYFAHLSRYRNGLREGHLVRRGEVVGYVGSTGNVQGSPHLHFAVRTVVDPNQWWAGRGINPDPLLVGAR